MRLLKGSAKAGLAIGTESNGYSEPALILAFLPAKVQKNETYSL